MILVTGGTGFVGPHVVRALLGTGRPVRCLARRPERVRGVEGCGLVRGDMTDAASLRQAVEGCDTVVHLVAIVLGTPQGFERVMIQGTRDLVAAAKEARVRRFVLMSALGTGEETKDATSYFRAKWEEEQAVASSGIEHTIFRPSFIFGPDGGMLPGLISMARYSPVTPILGTRRLQPIWSGDVAAFFAKAAADGPTGTYELGGPDQVSWEELYAAIRRVLGKRRLAFHVPLGLTRAAAAVGEVLPPLRGAREGVRMLDIGDNVTDIRPAVEAFGIEPIPLEEQIRRAVA